MIECVFCSINDQDLVISRSATILIIQDKALLYSSNKRFQSVVMFGLTLNSANQSVIGHTTHDMITRLYQPELKGD